MSLEATLWAWNLTVEPVTKLVLLAIADYSNSDKESWPSYETLSKKTGLNRRSIIRHCQKAVESGHISIKKRKINGSLNTTNVYKLLFSSSDSQSPPAGGVVTHSHQGSDSQSPGVVTHSHQGSDRESPKPTIEPPNIESTNKPIRGGSSKIKRKVVQKENPPACPGYLSPEWYGKLLKHRRSKGQEVAGDSMAIIIEQLDEAESHGEGGALRAIKATISGGWTRIIPGTGKPEQQNHRQQNNQPAANQIHPNQQYENYTGETVLGGRVL